MKIRRQLAILAALLGPCMDDALAAPTQQVGPAPAVPLGYQQLTTLGSPTAFTPPAGASWCIFYFEAAAIRWRDDGTNPSASVGMPQNIGDQLLYKVQNAGASPLVFIQQSSGAIIDATCYQ